MTDGAGTGHDEDRVDEMVEESFPASDPPSGLAGEDRRDVDRRTGEDPSPPASG
jgi:hypothetical protein